MPCVSTAMLEKNGPIPQNAPISGSPSAVAMDNNISAFCESTGGKCFVATNWKVLMQHIEMTASRLSVGVVVSFDQLPISSAVAVNRPPQVYAACKRKLLFVRPSQGYWPIPEAFWPDPSSPSLPARDPHPTIFFRPIEADPYIPTNFIYDKYEVESNPLVGFLLKAPAGCCWQVFVRNSKGLNHGYGDPFGFLKLDQVGSTLTLYVLPYNYPVLWQLLDQAGKMPGGAKMSHLPLWRQEMERYCNNCPSYYGSPLRVALKRMGLIAHVVPDSMEKSLLTGYVGTQLKRLKVQAKSELDALTEQMAVRLINGNLFFGSGERSLPGYRPPVKTEPPPGFLATSICTTMAGCASQLSSLNIGLGDPVSARKSWDSLIPSTPSSGSALPIVSSPPHMRTSSPNASEVVKSYTDSSSSLVNAGIFRDSPLFKNPFDIRREELLSHLKYLPMRIGLLLDARSSQRNDGDRSKRKLSPMSSLAAQTAAIEEEEARHSVPIEKMGDFSEALWKQQPPRSPFTEEQDRNKQHRPMFGNPYRQERSDGADEAWLDGNGGFSFRGKKRKRRSESISASLSLSGSLSVSENSSEAAAGNSEVTSSAKTPSEVQIMVAGPTQIFANDNSPRHKDKASVPSIRYALPMNNSQSVDQKNLHAASPETADNVFEGNKEVPINEDAQINTFQSEMSPRMEKANLLLVDATSHSVQVAEFSEEVSQCEGRRCPAMTPSGFKKDQLEVAEFIKITLRVLRYTKDGHTQKLFDILSVPDFPVDKASFVEQLIHQAHLYKKVAVAKDLRAYQYKTFAGTSFVKEKAH
ncbi:hypothetical protein O6H91_08G041500 [Diphasiastrum complanatum]|nr:hypothetical protein O6H91_08G041500 [Diphasiastrum complanatum]